jgi:hypothetical protein
MWISMCKNSVYLVKKTEFIHNKFTLDEIDNLETVNNAHVVHNLLFSFHKLIPSAFCLNKGLFKSFARFPHSLLLLLLSIKLNIINKTNLNWSFK